MACRRVIVNSVDAGSDYGEMFEREKMGFSSDIGDSEKLARDILFLYENPEVRETYANNAKSFGEREYSRTVNTKKYTELFEELTKR